MSGLQNISVDNGLSPLRSPVLGSQVVSVRITAIRRAILSLIQWKLGKLAEDIQAPDCDNADFLVCRECA